MDVEITVRAVSLPDIHKPFAADLVYGPQVVPLLDVFGSEPQWVYLHSRTRGWDHVVLCVEDFGIVDQEGWYGGRVTLRLADNSSIGSARPAAFYNGPCDIPMYTHFDSPWRGHWVVGLRSTKTAAGRVDAQAT